MMQNMKKQMSTTMNCILSSFDPNLQFRVTCELICGYSLAPEARIALLEYLNDLVEKHMKRGITLNTKEVKDKLLEMFSWMNDERIGSKISPHGEKLLCSLFDLNAADFSALFSEFNPDYPDSAYRILQSHINHAPPSEVVSNGDDINVRTHISSAAAKLEGCVISRNKEYAADKSPITKEVNSPSHKRVDVKTLRSLSSEMNSQRIYEEENFDDGFDRVELSSTIHLLDDVAEQSKFVSAKLAQSPVSFSFSSVILSPT
ncbi:hypothetical protein CAEBREN_14013 [Caenorhabditis brenneri]|uniref:Uncharacterized protein n=1 Tax=Caenorhabditis brenneri TaxID=135651 RepID=G0P0C0_CAEBE|nr:hypothetical protein CAEBREN_14013 [Caenorhabditis brenneri]